jgi:broad specificity phosphatase PhoE
VLHAFVTHAEVVVDPAVPIERWGLSDAGRVRAAAMPAVLDGTVDRVVSSAERKAVETAAVIAAALDLPHTIAPELGEMDRSATGYLPLEEFEGCVDRFFAEPVSSVRGWERAVDAQARIGAAVRAVLADGTGARTAFVAHGGVGALLLADLTGAPISRTLDQPGMGSLFRFDADAWRATSGWERLG